MLTREEVEKSLPVNLKGAATQSFTDMINNVTTDPLIAENIRTNFIGYTVVLRDGRFKTEDYLHAVTYVSYKLMGYTNLDAYCRTFPQRHLDLVAKGTSSKDIAAYVSAYNKGKLVNLILEQSLVPSWVLNQDLHQKAINVQADLMMNAASEKVRTDAANSLLTHLKKPETKDFQVSVNLEEASGMTELKNILGQLASQQQELIGKGVTTKAIAAQPIIEGEFVEHDPR